MEILKTSLIIAWHADKNGRVMILESIAATRAVYIGLFKWLDHCCSNSGHGLPMASMAIVSG